VALCKEIERGGRLEGSGWLRECKRGLMGAKVRYCKELMRCNFATLQLKLYTVSTCKCKVV